MKKIFRSLIIIAGLCLLITMETPLCAQEELSSRIGLSAVLQDAQLDIQLPIWLGSKVSLSPAIGLVYVGDSGSDIRIGVVPRIYTRKTKLSPFTSLRFGVLLFNPKEGDGATDIFLGIGFGGEYFFDKHFSMGVEAQLNLTISDENSNRFGNPGGNNVNTGSVIFATIYF